MVIGNLGADAEVKTSNGKKFVALSIADTRKFKAADGKEQVVTNWIDAIMNDADSAIIPYLKQGTKVAVYGDTSLRVYSSKKDRMMKAGATIHVRTIELVGGYSDDVPRQLIDPNTNVVFDVQKYYWVNADTKSWKKDDVGFLVDMRGNQYIMNKQGFVQPVKEEPATEGEGQTADTQSTQK